MAVFGDNSAGFKNEIKIEKCLNEKLFENITPNLQNFLKDVFKGHNLKGKHIHAIRSAQRMKPDFYLQIDGISKGVYVSVKLGSGNSIHQESLQNFISYLKELGASDKQIKYLKLYHFSDGTEDNSGKTRQDAKTFQKENPHIVEELNLFLNQKEIQNKLVDRFVFQGNIKDAPKADYVYHGTASKGCWASREEIYKYFNEFNVNNFSVHINELTYQTWNKNINFNPNTEDRRLQMQIKWGGVENTLNEITSRREEFKQNGTYEGDFTEKSSVIYFNRNPNNFKKYIKEINGLLNTTYLVRVTTKQYSKLSKQKVFTRADAYAITIKNNDLLEALEENEYYLDEDFLQKYSNSYEIIKYSGISIKIADSDSYQIIKFTPNSFNELFNNYSLGAGASIFCNKLEELPKNIDLLKGWNCSIGDLQKCLPDCKITQEILTTSTELCKQIKNQASEILTRIINSDIDIQKIIFNGIGIYEEPYTAYYFMQTYILDRLTYIPFTITTGSGRSHGDYSIVVKPLKSFRLLDRHSI